MIAETPGMRMGARIGEHPRGLVFGPRSWMRRPASFPARLLPGEQRQSREGGMLPFINRTDTVVVPGWMEQSQ